MHCTLTALALTTLIQSPAWNAIQSDIATPASNTSIAQVSTTSARVLTIETSDHSVAALPALALPGRHAIISAPLAETIDELLIAEGDTVEPNQPLLRFAAAIPAADLAAAEARARAQGAYAQARARLRFAEINEATMREARRTKAAGEMELLRATAEREQADAAHTAAAEQRDLARLEAERLRAQLARYTPTAPFRGVIARVHAEVGETPGSAQPLIEIVDLDTLRVEMHLPAQTFASLELGATYLLEAGAPVNQPVEATLTSVSRIIDPASRTIRCVFTIDNRSLALPSGFHVTAAQPSSETAQPLAGVDPTQE